MKIALIKDPVRKMSYNQRTVWNALVLTSPASIQKLKRQKNGFGIAQEGLAK